jgi:hypothetical protein
VVEAGDSVAAKVGLPPLLHLFSSRGVYLCLSSTSLAVWTEKADQCRRGNCTASWTG